MLIVCPTCATSYMIDPASVGTTGRSVRCARCRATWFAGPAKPAGPPSVSAFVDSVIAEAEAEQKSVQSPAPPSFEQPSASVAPDISDDKFPPPAFEAPPAPASFDPPPFNADPEPAAFEHDAAPPVTIADAPSISPPQEPAQESHEPLFPPDSGNPFFRDPPETQDDGEEFVARRARLKAKRKTRSSISRWTVIALVLLGINVALIGARSEVVRYMPQTASLFAAIGLPVNLRNLEFEGINITKEVQDGVTILVIGGRIVNVTGKAVDVPRIRFAARTASGQEVYSWTMQPPRSILGPGDSLPFTNRLAAPPADAADILVRFFNAQDVAKGGK